MRVLVLDTNRQPLMPCHPARARQLLAKGKAAVFRHFPFTIILKHRTGGNTQPLSFQVDPGSKTTGVALVADFRKGRCCVFALHIAHRGQQIHEALNSRRGIRRSRRHRHCRYRPVRFLNRRKPKGWLPPSVMSRVDNVETWAKRLAKLAPVTGAEVETVRFDTQQIQNPDINGVEYQRGELADWELREYLLYRHQHCCAYCHGLSGDPVLEREHVVPRSKGGSNRLSNQVIACKTCNRDKGSTLPEQWLEQCQKGHRAIDGKRAKTLPDIIAGKRPSLKDAAAVNASRYAIGDIVRAIWPEAGFWSGGRTKRNRTAQGFSKDHWIDAACVGERGDNIRLESGDCLVASSRGHGSRQQCRMDRFGFPRTSAKAASVVHGFRTGDRVVADVPAGKKAGHWEGRVAVRSSGSFNIRQEDILVQGIGWRYCRKVQCADGYGYRLQAAA